SWATARAKSAYGCSLSSDAAERLVDLAGLVAGRLDSELSKLATYVVPRKQIVLQDVELLVGSNREEKVFGIVDAIARQDAATALELWQQVLATDRAAPFRALGGLAWGFRRWANARRMLDDGAPLPVAARVAGFFDSGDAFRRQIGRMSTKQWEDCLVKVLSVDGASKTGLGATELAVERLIVDMCASGAGNRV